MRRLISCFATGMLILPVSASGERGRTHRYVGWVQNESFSLNESIGVVEYADDVTSKAEFCSAESKFVCFFSMYHAFAVPKNLDSAGRQWSVHGVNFELVAEHLSLSIAGREFTDLLLIRTPAEATVVGRQTGKPGLSLFSSKFGLIGFSIPRELTTYWIEGKYGFGASEVGIARPSKQ